MQGKKLRSGRRQRRTGGRSTDRRSGKSHSLSAVRMLKLHLLPLLSVAVIAFAIHAATTGVNAQDAEAPDSMLERISSVRLQDEVRALASQPQALKASLREFGRHKTSEALFDYRGGMLSQVQAQGALSPESKNLLFDVFQSASDAEADREAKTELLARLAPEEQLGLIRAAEDSLDFRVYTESPTLCWSATLLPTTVNFFTL